MGLLDRFSRASAASILVMASVNLLTTAPALAVSQRPRDTCKQVAGYSLLRTRLEQIVATRSKQGLLDLVDETITNSFGGSGGKQEFIEMWALDSAPKRSPVWDELGALLTLGCVAEDGAVALPYFFNAPIPAQLEPADVFTLHLVTGTGVALRTGPSLDSDVLTRLNWTVLNTIDDWDGVASWRHVQLADGCKGYVHTRYLRSQVDYRAIFERQNGTWALTALVAGD